jgi:hypothetical protein
MFVCQNCNKLCKSAAGLKNHGRVHKNIILNESLVSINDPLASVDELFTFNDSLFDNNPFNEDEDQKYDEKLVENTNKNDLIIDLLDETKRFRFQSGHKFKIFHLNINSLRAAMKNFEIQRILDSCAFDILLLNETKLDSNVPDKYFLHKKYYAIRRDRDDSTRGGGILVFVKKSYVIKSIVKSSNFELLSFNLQVRNSYFQFVCAYRSPKVSQVEFLSYLETHLALNMNMSQPIFIIGDLNMNLLASDDGLISVNGKLLKEFIDNYSFKCHINKPTRTASYLSKRNGTTRVSSTLIDVLLSNTSYNIQTVIIDNHISDHMAIFCSIEVKSESKISPLTKMARDLRPPSLQCIYDCISVSNFTPIYSATNVREMWLLFYNVINDAMNKSAPVKKMNVKGRNIDHHPWVDTELLNAKQSTDKAYKQAKHQIDSKMNQVIWLNFTQKKQFLNKLYNQKMIHYFETKNSNDFKNSKKFYEFYSSFINLKSSKNDTNISEIIVDGKRISDKKDICNNFNFHFTNICSNSNINKCESANFIFKHF